MKNPLHSTKENKEETEGTPLLKVETKRIINRFHTTGGSEEGFYELVDDAIVLPVHIHDIVLQSTSSHNMERMKECCEYVMHMVNKRAPFDSY